MHDHPYVSEDHEGKPWFEWAVAAVVALAVAVAAVRQSNSTNSFRIIC